MKSSALPYRRIVIKLGSNLLTSGRQCLDVEMMASLVLQIAALHKQGLQTIMVTSRPIAAGNTNWGKRRNKGYPYKQVLAAVGQARLMNVYEELFDRHDIVIAQALLTKADMSDRLRYLNARNTL